MMLFLLRVFCFAGRHRFYAFCSLNYFLNSAIGIIVHIVYTNRPPVTAACWQTAIVIEKIGFPLVV